MQWKLEYAQIWEENTFASLSHLKLSISVNMPFLSSINLIQKESVTNLILLSYAIGLLTCFLLVFPGQSMAQEKSRCQLWEHIHHVYRDRVFLIHSEASIIIQKSTYTRLNSCSYVHMWMWLLKLCYIQDSRFKVKTSWRG